VAVRDRLDDVLQARSLPDDLVAPGRLPAKPLHRLIRHPDFPQKIARVKLGEDLRVDRIRFDLRMSDDAHGLGFAITTCLTCGAITAATVDALSVASSTTILLGELLCESLEKMTAHVDAPQAFELVLVPGGRLGESAIGITTIPAVGSFGASTTSSPPTPSPEGSRPSTALRPMSSSANDDNRTGTIQTEPAIANAGLNG
jgi:hypothetical protein